MVQFDLLLFTYTTTHKTYFTHKMEGEMLNMNDETICAIAREYSQKREFGKSCSYYLLLFHKHPTKVTCSIKNEFLNVFSKWLYKLLRLNGIVEFMSFLESVLEVCTFKVNVILIAAEVLFQEEYILEASKLLLSCSQSEENFQNYELKESIEQLHNFLIDRWHFRMLNDKRRNLAYSLAIQRALADGHEDVLDIGSGTGLFSFFAVHKGFKKIYSVEASEVMCDVQLEATETNFVKNIKLINKMSTDLEIGKDIAERVSLIVTEVFDCGLLGEGILKTLKHAWKHLLRADNSKVIPESATVYAVCVECEELRKHTSYQDKDCIFYGSRDPGDIKDQPYTTENMKYIRGGYKALSKPSVVKQFNFNDPQRLMNVTDEKQTVDVAIEFDGVLDAIMVYFVLNLGSNIQINSHPDADSCWEQALYCVKSNNFVKQGTIAKLYVTCYEEYLDIEFCEKSQLSVCNPILMSDKVNEPMKKIFNTDRRLISRLNDQLYTEKYSRSILEELDYLSDQKDRLNICMLCGDASLFPVLASLKGSHDLYLVEPTQVTLEMLLHKNASASKRIKILSRPLVEALSCNSIEFDLIICEPVDCNGLIKENFIEDFATLKTLATSNNTRYLPSSICMYAVCISSEQLLRENRVLNDDVTLGMKIASAINRYKVSNHPDVDACSLNYNTLSDVVNCGVVDFVTPLTCQEDIHSMYFCEKNLSFAIKSSGKLVGLITWFELRHRNETLVSTKPSTETHWHQSCIILPINKMVSSNDVLLMRYVRNKSNFHFFIVNEDE